MPDMGLQQVKKGGEGLNKARSLEKLPTSPSIDVASLSSCGCIKHLIIKTEFFIKAFGLLEVREVLFAFRARQLSSMWATQFFKLSRMRDVMINLDFQLDLIEMPRRFVKHTLGLSVRVFPERIHQGRKTQPECGSTI
jgi:hypothetical protein